MIASRTTGICLLLVLSSLLLGMCPLAPPATLSAARNNGQCRHEQQPVPTPHSCCVNAHHQPALVRPVMASAVAVPTPAMVITDLRQMAQDIAATGISPSPSPPVFRTLRI